MLYKKDMIEHDYRSERMKKEPLLILALVLVWSTGVLAAQTPPPPPLVPAIATLTPSATNLGPRIQFASMVHDFGQILSGAVVRHDFVFTNTGDAVLDVNNVAASCGCTTAGDWSRKVVPGQTGTIPIQFNSGHFSGSIFKTITVSCNDSRQPSVMLQIKGTIWKPVEVSPETAVLNANSETAAGAKVSVRIQNREATPLHLSSVQSANRVFSAELRTNQLGSDYELLIGVQPPAPTGNSQGVITIQTSSTNAPVLNVNALLLLQPTVLAMPAQLYLPPGPLPSKQTMGISIMNNGTNALTLSDAQVNTQDVGVEIKEIAPNRHFNVLLSFPGGFELPPGKSTELSVKSTHPQFPVIKVPIVQPARSPGIPAARMTPPVASPSQPAPVPRPPVQQTARPAASAHPLTAPPPPPPLPPS